MKKFFISLIGAACFTVIVASCNKQEGVEVAPTQEKEPTSMIDLMEKEEGVKFFKRDVTLKDATGTTQVLMRFASKDEEVLLNYLLMYNFSVTPVFSDNVSNSSKEAITTTETKNELNIPNAHFSVMTESMRSVLPEKAVGYRLNVKPNAGIIESMKKKGLKVAQYGTLGEHISEVWPTWNDTRVDPLPISGFERTNNIQFSMEHRWRWNSSWQPAAGWTILSSNPNSSRTWSFNVDGPWKVMARIYYDPFVMSGSGYDVSWRRY